MEVVIKVTVIAAEPNKLSVLLMVFTANKANVQCLIVNCRK